MKFLRKLLDGVEPTFTSGKLRRFYPLYEAMDTFLYTPGEVTREASHIRDALDMKRMMSLVVVALAPCIFMAFYNTGYQANLAIAPSGAVTSSEPVLSSEAVTGPETITASRSVAPLDTWRTRVIELVGCGYDPNSFLANMLHGGLYFLPVYFVCLMAGGIWELVFASVRKHEINEGFLVTSMLFPLTLPPAIPLWQVALGISFGVVIGKEVFGGTGKNFLNPALTARAFLYFAYPAQITGNAVWTAADGFTSATPLGALAAAPVEQGIGVVTDNLTWLQAFLGNMPGSMGETSTLACLIGAVILIGTGIGSWQIMAAVAAGGMGLSTLFWMTGSDTNALFDLPPYWHLVIGGFAFGTVFMATDPVSAAMTSTGKWIYGILIGAMTILIRVINPAYPEGIMLAILFGNTMAPLIDYFVVQANIKRRKARYVA
ncbi:MAG TPA: NADH:ubiquinone reductase (Na(+)-transporting) subunit B [Pirellulales bacterium]|nr:NADH:ubiquinone reductase (Na(+)-transporting) subunit B [Pirellulales bacterium]